MGLMWTKHWGGRHGGGGVVVDKHGVRRAPFRLTAFSYPSIFLLLRHVFIKSSIALIPLLAVSSHASPLPQDLFMIGFSDTDSIYGIRYNDPLNAEKNSDMTDGDSQGISNLDCTNMGASNRTFPTAQNRFFTPPALFHAYHEALQNRVITETLNVSTIVNDSGEPSSSVNIYDIISGTFTATAGLIPPSLVSKPLNNVAGVFGILANVNSLSIGPTVAIQSQLSRTFNATEQHLSCMVRIVFGGVGNTSAIPRASGPGPDGGVTGIAKFFPRGRFPILVTLHKFHLNPISNPPRSEDISSDLILKLDNPDDSYNIDLDEFCRNIDACQNAHPNFDGEVTFDIPKLQDSLLE
ncbi:hypothetical protein CC78DRAFT_588232 [Lojkania enalia]|uniref:Uncharacterized protein n=1 Tax=Lojkania enalia TaxID=147567 RepID=A0A9P4JVD2_9PLEO|nr:hypothetical protein CC78DRAFT_588232 [Didymosphaeria enalia]